MLLYSSFLAGAGGAAGTLPPFIGALAKRITSTQSVSTATFTPIDYNGEEYDTASFHDNSSNPSRFTVPAAYNGRKGRLSGNLKSATANTVLAVQNKNAGNYQGGGSQDATTSSPNNVNFMGAPVALATGDYFQNVAWINAATGVPADDANWGQLEVFPTSFAGALVKHSATQSISSSLHPVTLAWDGEEYDTDAFHDTVTNNSRLTIPAAFNGRHVRLSVGIVLPGASTSAVAVIIQKNGADVHGLPLKLQAVSGTEQFSCVSAPIQVATGDYFTVVMYYFNASAQNVPAADANVWFAIDVLPNPFSGALVKRTTNQLISSTTAIMTWEAEQYDVGGWWSGGSPTRLTVPSGVTKVRLTANIRPGSTSGKIFIRTLKNGSSFVGMLAEGAAPGTSGSPEAPGGVSAVVAVSAGDYFELEVTDASSENFGSSTNVWFSIEAVE
ncbi:hypothetical protein [Mesorhizobium sp. KR9-304]|uniref:hypothetical protein n=1 Tax=Mesorhizobium sp. KR9-304 TaxID=3156614 RepID=UPI0032B4265F